MQKSKIAVIAVMVILVSLVIFLTAQWFMVKTELNQLQKTAKVQQTNENILSFINFFIEKVLLAQGEVSFEDRLRMENMVRDLKDQQVLDQWAKFSKSETALEVQQELVNLLKLLLSKVTS